MSFLIGRKVHDSHNGSSEFFMNYHESTTNLRKNIYSRNQQIRYTTCIQNLGNFLAVFPMFCKSHLETNYRVTEVGCQGTISIPLNIDS